MNAGDVYVIPKGVMHNPVADEEYLVMLFEKRTTLHTGTTNHDEAKSITEQLKSI